MSPILYLPAMGIATCLGIGKAANASGFFSGDRVPFTATGEIAGNRTVPLGAIPDPLPPLAKGLEEFESRNNRLLALLIQEIRDEAEAAIKRFGPDRVAVILGTSTSGIAEGETALAQLLNAGQWPEQFSYSQQETGSPSAFVARALGITGPAYVIATACSSSAKAFLAARRLINFGLVDVAIVGGADTLCKLTVAGFSSLEALSQAPCNPFSRNRDGITIGEGGALFVLTRDPAEIALLGGGESSDAHHVSAPAPDGRGAILAMEQALADARLAPSDITYLNLHGTATPLNDRMESHAVAGLFGTQVPCSSTKALTGHTLGAAGAVEAAVLWLTLSAGWNPERRVPPHLWDGAADPDLAPINLASNQSKVPARPRLAALSNSFAFGGSNCALVLGRGFPA